MQWYLRAEMIGTVDIDQAETLLKAGAFAVEPNPNSQTVRVQLTIEAPDHGTALTKAKRTLERLDALTELVDTGALSQPYRITIEEPGAPAPDAPFMNAKAFGDLLGRSERRVLQLVGRPGFPEPFTVPGRRGKFFWTADVTAYLPTHSSEGGGRPRAGDEKLLRDGLRLLAEHAGGDLTHAQRRQVETAIAAEGGRYVKGKAKVLSELARRPQGSPDPRKAMTGDEKDRYTEAVERADEIWGA